MVQVAGTQIAHVVLRLPSQPIACSVGTQTDLLAKAIHTTQGPISPRNWHARALSSLDTAESWLQSQFPDSLLQRKIDKLGRAIQAKFACFTKFNQWLDSNGHGKWFEQLTTFLVKLPLRAVRNIIGVLYSIVKASLYALVHPMEAVLKLARLLTNLVHELTKPETWTVIGAGMVGASLGQALMTSNPLSVLSAILGACFVIGGITAGAIKAAIQAAPGNKLKAARQNFLTQVKMIPEATLTGFLMGLIIGRIQRAYQWHKVHTGVSNQREAIEWAHQKSQQYGLPKPAEVFISERYPEYLHIRWEGADRIIKELGPSPYSFHTAGDWFKTTSPYEYNTWANQHISRAGALTGGAIATLKA